MAATTPGTTISPVGALAVVEAGEANRAFDEAAVSREDIERFTVPEGLSDVERAQLYLKGGKAVQQLAVLHNLPGLIRAAGHSAWTAISQGLLEMARELDADGQVALADVLGTLARERLLPAGDVADAILPMALAGASEVGSTHLATQTAWLACLAEACAAVEPPTLHTRILPVVVARCTGNGRTLRERCQGCELLGAVAPHVGADELQRTLVRLATSLSMDTEWQVRHAACKQLPVLAAAAAKADQAAVGAVLEDVFALLEDEEALVRSAAWRAVAAAVDLLPAELRRARMLPLMLAQSRELDPHAEVQRSLAAGFGALATRLVPDMDGDAEVGACLGMYRSLAWRHDHATRMACASGLPAVLKACGARRYSSHLHDTLLRLASDGDAEVRLAVANALPEVAAALGVERCCQHLRQPVAALLQDEKQDVQAALLTRLPAVLQHFGGSAGSTTAPGAGAVVRLPRAGASAAVLAVAAAAATAADEQRGKTCTPFVEPLLRLEAACGYNWRLQLALLRAIADFPAFFSSDQLYDRFLPIALNSMAQGVAAVRAAAAGAAAAIWRALRKPAHRTALYSRVIHEYGQSKCFRHRVVFIDFCQHAQQHFSTKFVKDHLMEPALSLAYDPVANVRLHLAAALPALKQAVALPDDVHLLERLNSALSRLITDGNGDVCHAARKSNEEFKRLPVRMSCGALDGSSPEVKAFEAADAARMNAERDFLFDAETVDKIHADIATYDEQLHPGQSRLALQLPAARCAASSTGAGTPGSSGRGARGAQAAGAGSGAKSRSGVPLSGVRSASDGPDLRRDKSLAGCPHTRSASAGSVSSGGKAAGVGVGNSAGRLRAAASDGCRSSDGSASSDDGGNSTQGQRQTVTGSTSSRLGRPGLGTGANKAHATGPPKLARTSPSVAAKSTPGLPVARTKASPSTSPTAPPPAAVAAGAQGSSSSSRDEPASTSNSAAGDYSAHRSSSSTIRGKASSRNELVKGRHEPHAAASKQPAGKVPAVAASESMSQLASKLKAGLRLHTTGVGTEIPAAATAAPLKPGVGSSSRRLVGDGLKGSGSSRCGVLMRRPSMK